MKRIAIVLGMLAMSSPAYSTDITWADKTTGGTFSAADANEVKTAVNSKADKAAALVGDCTVGPCLDGSSDGGNLIKLWAGAGAYWTALQGGAPAANRSWRLPIAAPPSAGETNVMTMDEYGQMSFLDKPSTSGYVLSSTDAGVLSWIANGSGGSMVYPGAGIPNSTGSAWGTSYTLDADLSSVSASDDSLPSAKATKAALDQKAPIDNPTFTTGVTAPSFSTNAADGSRYTVLPSNTSISPLGDGSEQIYNEGGQIKVVEGDTEYNIINSGDVDDTPVNGETAVPVSSNWAYDHAAATATHGVSGAIVGTSDSATLTNKTLDVEGTGNSITIVDKVWFAAAGCNNATATSFYDLPTSNPAAAACITGTNTQKGVLDFDAATDESGQVSLALPSDWSGNIDLKYKWLAAATSGNVVWAVQTSCVADAETDDPSWNTASTVTDAAKGTTLQTNDASMTSITVTGCAAGELLHLRLFRDADNASDTMTGDARLIGAELTIRRAQ